MKTLRTYTMAIVLLVGSGCGSMPSAGTDGDTRPEPGGSGNGDLTMPETPVCPPLQETFSTMAPASYAVVVVYRNGPGAGDIVNFTLGSAFAVGPHTLATNAHVANGILANVYPVDEVLAVQAGTGRVFDLTSATKHPGYDGDPLESPDVAVLSSRDEFPTFLDLASDEDTADLAAGDLLALTGFPGDVNELFNITPGTTVPQATSLSGAITALRSFEATAIVTADTVDVLQHQLPTTPGTSGSPLVRCGKVVGVHNAGTVNLIISVDENGNLVPDRQSAAANNFGIHVRHLRDLIDRVQGGLLSEEALPPPDPDYSGSYACAALAAITATFTHGFTLTIEQDRSVGGVSLWSNVTLILEGSIDRFGAIQFSDNGASRGFVPILYTGFGSVQTNEIVGLYFEGDTRLGVWGCQAD